MSFLFGAKLSAGKETDVNEAVLQSCTELKLERELN